ncbi:hypothetical protein L2E82_19080 [Cichorium intybus]|uniref:Uncharacterized protein n=1 Tax=Cichorium intybus TaxID=13427 RepID=A0ACB9FCK0_CICIN|nr:hypothetical protein L2E82_19080 [Cichorium intybus]
MQKYLTYEEYSYSGQRSRFRLVKRVWFCTIFYPAAGIESMDRKFLDGWVIFTEYARPRESSPPSPPSN